MALSDHAAASVDSFYDRTAARFGVFSTVLGKADEVQITTTNVELTIEGFPCRTYVAAPKPAQPVVQYPGIILYSEIFQLTAPICRTANRLAGHGFVVAAPEIYHRTCPPGLVIAYDDPGRMYGNYLAHTTPVAHFDATATAVFDHFETRNDLRRDSSGPSIGAIGFCIGGHLALRAALDPRCRAAVCAYPTGVHNGNLGADPDAGTLDRLAEIKGGGYCWSSGTSTRMCLRLRGASFARRCKHPARGIRISNCPANMRSCATRVRVTIRQWPIAFSWRPSRCTAERSANRSRPRQDRHAADWTFGLTTPIEKQQSYSRLVVGLAKMRLPLITPFWPMWFMLRVNSIPVELRLAMIREEPCVASETLR